MSEEEKELLKKSVDLAEENNEILRSMRRSMRFARVFKIVYWTILIGTAIGAFYFMQPYIDQLVGVYGGAKSNLDGFSSFFK